MPTTTLRLVVLYVQHPVPNALFLLPTALPASMTPIFSTISATPPVLLTSFSPTAHVWPARASVLPAPTPTPTSAHLVQTP